jgi:hypothetical protein
MKLKTLDTDTVKIIQANVLLALEEIEQNYGISFSSKGARFSPSSCVFKIEASIVDDSGVAKNIEREDFSIYASMYGLNPQDLDKVFAINGDPYQIAGISPRKPKYPVIAVKLSNGKKYKFSAMTVKNLLATKPALV